MPGQVSGRKHGAGKLLLPDGSFYDGEFKCVARLCDSNSASTLQGPASSSASPVLRREQDSDEGEEEIMTRIKREEESMNRIDRGRDHDSN